MNSYKGFQPSAGFISAGREDKGPSEDLSGQPLYAGYGDYGGGYGGFDGFGADLFGHSWGPNDKIICKILIYSKLITHVT